MNPIYGCSTSGETRCSVLSGGHRFRRGACRDRVEDRIFRLIDRGLREIDRIEGITFGGLGVTFISLASCSAFFFFKFSRVSRVNTGVKGRRSLMADGCHAEDDLCLRVAEEASCARQRVERLRRQTKNCQRSAADSFDRSADSHDRTARSYEQLAQRGRRHAEYLEHAARHREFAQEDRRIARQLRQLAESSLMRGSRHPQTVST